MASTAAQKRAYYDRNREAVIARAQAHHRRNRPARLVAMRDNYAANRDQRCEADRAYYQRNREAYFDRAALRRARKSARFVERVFRSVVFKRDGGLCGICTKPVDPEHFHLDHVMPLALGGEHSYANIQLAHPLCNRQKGARAPSQTS